MGQKRSRGFKLETLSFLTDINTGVLSQVLDKEYSYKPPNFGVAVAPISEASKQSVSRLIETAPEVEEKELSVQIAETNDLSGLVSLFNDRVSSDLPEFLLCYEKIQRLANIEISKAKTKEDFENLYDILIYGSVEESICLMKVIEFENEEILALTNIDELIDVYQNNNYHENSKRLAAQRIVKLVTTIDEMSRVIDDVFLEGTPEFFEMLSRSSAILTEAISKMTDLDEVDSIYKSIPHEADEELLLAQKIVELAGGDVEIIWSKGGVFESNTEAKEILALAVIENTSSYSVAEDHPLNRVSDCFDRGSRIKRLVDKKINELFSACIKDLEDVSELDSIMGDFNTDDPNQIIVADKIISAVSSLEDVVEIIDDYDSSSYIHVCARKKFESMVFELIANAKKIEDLQVDLIKDRYPLEEDTEIGRAYYKKMIELSLSVDDMDVINLEDSYCKYLLMKKFPVSSAKAIFIEPIKPLVAETKKEVVEEDDFMHRQRIDSENLQKIQSAKDPVYAIKFFNSLPGGDASKKTAYQKSSELLRILLQQPEPSKKVLLQLIQHFPVGTSEWGSCIDRLAESFKKPWWMFW